MRNQNVQKIQKYKNVQKIQKSNKYSYIYNFKFYFLNFDSIDEEIIKNSFA